MNMKKILLFTALVCASSGLNVVASAETMDKDLSSWIEGLNYLCSSSIEGVLLSNSFAAKQCLWYSLDVDLNDLKTELQDEVARCCSQEGNDTQIQICESKIKAVDSALAQLDDAVSKIEKQFLMPTGRFKLEAVRFIESQKK
jgi:hypothetical protein